jgi:hypothetical protein
MNAPTPDGGKTIAERPDKAFSCSCPPALASQWPTVGNVTVDPSLFAATI